MPDISWLQTNIASEVCVMCLGGLGGAFSAALIFSQPAGSESDLLEE